jgi:cytidylate kinase
LEIGPTKGILLNNDELTLLGFPRMSAPYTDDFELPQVEEGASPLHGYRGPREGSPVERIPAGLTIAISREAGSRGATIAKRAGEKLGWDIYTQELVDYIVQHADARQELEEKLPVGALAWVEGQMSNLTANQHLSRIPAIQDLSRLVMMLGAQGNLILLGRGGGFVLPQSTTLHVRLVAPLADRVAYMSQWLRLTEEEAADQVRKRDQRRTEFLSSHFHRTPNDVHVYDMVLNTSLLGEERCSDLIAAAAKAKMSAIVGMD